MNLPIKVACVYAIIFLIALSVATAYRYRAEQYYDKANRLCGYEAYDIALPQMIKAVRLNPFCLGYRNKLNGLVLVMGTKARTRYLVEWAIQEAEATTRKFPEHYFSYYIVAQGYHVLGYKEAAIWYYRKAIELHPYKVDRNKLKLLL